ncbi:MAG: hypothetical protein V1704_02950 [Candidatus Vogelbacteria bacterium]
MPNTKHGFGSAGLIIVILIIIAGGAYLWSQKKVEAPAPTNVPVGTTAVDTTDWKTYRNEEYGFEVKLPVSWKIIIEQSLVGSNYLNFRRDNVCAEGYYSGYNEGMAEGLTKEISRSTKIIDGHKTDIFLYTPSTGSKYTYRYQIEKDKCNLYQFFLITLSQPTEELKGTVDQILSTFRFTK